MVINRNWANHCGYLGNCNPMENCLLFIHHPSLMQVHTSGCWFTLALSLPKLLSGLEHFTTGYYLQPLVLKNPSKLLLDFVAVKFQQYFCCWSFSSRYIVCICLLALPVRERLWNDVVSIRIPKLLVGTDCVWWVHAVRSLPPNTRKWWLNIINLAPNRSSFWLPITVVSSCCIQYAES